MGFWKKLKKMKFWEKREERGSKDESVIEDLETIFPTHIQKLQKKQEMDANQEQLEAVLCGTITELEEKCRAKDSERKQIEACLCIRICELEEKLEKTNSEKELVEATLLSQKSEIERERKEAEADLCSQTDRMKRENKEREDDWKKIEGALHGQI